MSSSYNVFYYTVFTVHPEEPNRLRTNDTLLMREQVAEHSVSQGYWSVWMTVFKDDPDMLRRFIEAFPGTCQDCFDYKGNPIPRPNGNL